MKTKLYLSLFICLYFAAVNAQNIRVYSSNGDYSLEGPTKIHVGGTGTYVFYSSKPYSPGLNVTVINWGWGARPQQVSTEHDRTTNTRIRTYRFPNKGNFYIEWGGCTIDFAVVDDAYHTPTGTCSFGNISHPLSLIDNFILMNTKTDVQISMPNVNSYSYELLSPSRNVTNLHYTPSSTSLNIQFTPVVPSVEFKLTLNWGCCTTTEYLIFRAYPPDYNVTSTAGQLVISKEISEENGYVMSNITPQQVKYEIVDMNTGIIKKNGFLHFDYNNIDISTVPNGMYVVRIISGDRTNTHKITIKH